MAHALAASGQLMAFADPQPPLLIMAATAIAVLVLLDWAILCKGTATGDFSSD